VLDRIEFGAKRTIDHAAAEFDNEATDDRRIDIHVERNVLARHRLQRGLEGIEILVAELFGHRHISGRLALELRHQRTESADHLIHGEQPPIGGKDFQEIGGNARNTGLFEHRRQCLHLRIGRKNWTANETLQISAVRQHRIELVEVGFDGVN
jgi:hypothetical protein